MKIDEAQGPAFPNAKCTPQNKRLVTVLMT